MSLSGSAETIWPFDRVPSTKDSRIVVAPSTTWSAVRIAPLALTMTPVPNPAASPLDDGAARLDLDERRQDLLVDDRRGRRRRAQVLDRLLDDARRDRSHVATLERGLRRTARREADDDPSTTRRRENRRDRDPGAPARAAAPAGRLIGCGGRRLAGLCARRHLCHAREPGRRRSRQIRALISAQRAPARTPRDPCAPGEGVAFLT